MAEEHATVHVEQGALRGRRAASKSGGHFFSFQGVPYAKPPVGPLRFKVAELPEPWVGTRNALDEGPPSPQIDWILNLPYQGDEDCLYLNVYTSKLPTSTDTVKNPVMVWIHGGGFHVGSGSTDTYGPDYLVNEGIVLVTINYRLGVFGFLSLQSSLQPDNLGLKDQVAALRWIKQNIAKFGGDPDNVTIFGESAGGASVNYHMLSPMSKGLFHKSIMQSGCASNGWTIANNPKELAFALGKDLGCDTTDVNKLLMFLSAVPARDLIEANHIFNMKQQFGWKQWHFGPVPETHVEKEEEIFLPSHPKKLMEEGKFHSVPCIIGTNSQEGIFFISVVGILKNPAILRSFNDHFESQVPNDLKSTQSKVEIAQKIKQFYFGDKKITETSLEQYVDFASDVWFNRGADHCVKILAAKSSPVYYYHFSFSGKLNIFKSIANASHFSGASHMDELGYLFSTSSYGIPDVQPESLEWLTLKRMLKLWTNFAKTGNPTPSTDALVSVQWPPYTSSDASYLSIKSDLSIEQNLYEERIAFWNNL